MASKKISDIYDQLDRGETQSALAEINNIVGKEKNLKKMSQQEVNTFKLLKALCLVRTSEGHGEAKQIMHQIFPKDAENIKIPPEFMIVETIALGLYMLPDIKKIVDAYYKSQEQNEENVRKYMYTILKSYDFDGAQKICQKLYGITKDDSLLFLSIFMQTLDKAKKPNYMILSLFLDKVFKAYQINEENFKEIIQEKFKNNPKNNVAYQVINFQAQLLFDQEKYKECFEYIMKYDFVFEEKQKDIEFITKIYEKLPEKAYLNKLYECYFKIFQRNTDIENFEMVFDTYKAFTQQVFKLSEEKLDQSILNIGDFAGSLFEASLVTEKDLSPKEILSVFYQSLKNHEKILFEKSQKHHHFKNALKAVLQSQYLVLVGLWRQNNGSLQNLVKEFVEITEKYTQNFGAIFTFPEELYSAIGEIGEENLVKVLNLYEVIKKVLEEKEQGGSVKIKECIKGLNLIKIEIILFKMRQIPDFKEFYNQASPILSVYISKFTEIYEGKEITTEKGERLWQDDYLMIIADMGWELFSRFENLQKDYFEFMLQIIVLLELGHYISQYNFDFSVRLMKYYSFIGNFDRILELYRHLDIKGVQYDTLGNLFMNQGLMFYIYNKSDFQNMVNQATNYYIENNRESKYSLVSAVKNANFDQLKEVIEWDNWIKNSYLKTINQYLKLQQLNATLYKKNQQKNFNTTYHLKEIETCLNNISTYTFNIDMKQFQPLYTLNLTQDSHFFKNYLGPFQNPDFLRLQLTLRQLQNLSQDFFEEGNEEKIQEAEALLQKLGELLKSQPETLKNTFDIQRFAFYNKGEQFKQYKYDEKLQKDLQAKEINNVLSVEFKFSQIDIAIFENLINLNKYTPKTLEQLEPVQKSYETLKKLLTDVLQTDFPKILKDFDPTVDVFPFELYRSVYRFFGFTLRNLQIYANFAENIKAKLTKISKKAGGDKKKIVTLQKDIAAFLSEIVEVCKQFSVDLGNQMDAYSDKFLEGEKASGLYKLIENSSVKSQVFTVDGSQKSVSEIFSEVKQFNVQKVLDKVNDSVSGNFKGLAKNMAAYAKENSKSFIIPKN